MDDINYKQPQTRVVYAAGRHSVEVFIAGEWVPVAVREEKDKAEAIERGLRELLHQHKDER